jgi:Uncharacterized conserved protein
MKRFADLSEQEILALAITNEEEDSRIYQGFADGLRAQYPSSAKNVRGDGARGGQASRHAVRPLPHEVRRISAADSPAGRQGLRAPQALWLVRPLGLDEVRKYAAEMEFETARFYRKAAEHGARRLGARAADQLAEAEDKHESLAEAARREDPQSPAPAPRRTRPPGACSCCNTSSPASPA